MLTRTTIGLALALAAATGCDSTGPSEPGPELPPPLTSAWHATHVRGLAVPDAMYVWDPDTLYGEPVSVHLIVDSAKLVIQPTGRYTHGIWVSHWVGEEGGPPLTRTARFYHGDFGEWQRDGTTLSFESNWLQNHRMTGSYSGDGVLHMRHGFSHGDPPVELRYGT